MSSINKILGGLFPHREPKEDEYVNKADGLIYCAKCHTPRQCVIQHGDRIVTPPVMCDCQRIAEEKAEAAFQKRQEEFRIERMKASGLQDRYLHDYTFANDKGYNPEIKKAQRYVAEWAMMKENCIGLLLWGNVGTGKTFIAACIANAPGMFDVDRNKFIESFNRYSLLIIDDLGIERNSEFALEQVFNVIDSRYRSKKPLIITTNLTLDELKHPKDLAHARIYDRVLERCVPLKVNRQNIRQLNAANTLRSAKKLFSTEEEA